MLNITKLNEFYIDVYEGEYEIIDNQPDYVIGVNPHYTTRYTKRIKQMPKVLGLPATSKELIDLVLDKCESNYKRGLKEFSDRSLKGYYTQKHPVVVKSKDKKDLFRLTVELTVMYNVANIYFKDPNLAKQLVGLRRQGASLEDRNQFIKANCHPDWIPYLESGKLNDDKIAVFIESVAISISELSPENTYPATWTNTRAELGRVPHEFPEITANKTLIKNIIESITQDADCAHRIESGVVFKYCQDNKIKLTRASRGPR